MKIAPSVSDVRQILENVAEPVFSGRILEIHPGDAGAGRWNEFINETMAGCSGSGGGKVVVNAGDYLCEGPVVLRSNVNLHLNEGARLVFSQNPDDYLPVVFVRWGGVEIFNYSPFIYAKDERNIAITGKGVIDGNALAENSFRNWINLCRDDENAEREMGRAGVPVEKRVFGKGRYLRPQMVHFIGCRNILMDGVMVKNGSFWMIHPAYCRNVTIRNVAIESDFINNDGIDIDSSTDVLIENCRINTGDDIVGIKSGLDQDGWRVNKPSRNIVIRNCHSDTCLHGISFGSEVSAGVENVYVEDIVLKKVGLYGIQFKSNKDRGGYVRNIGINGMRMDTAETCISFTNDYHGYAGGNHPSLFENICVENVSCNVANGRAVNLEGLPEMPFRNIELAGVSVQESRQESRMAHVESLSLDGVALGRSLKTAPEQAVV